MIFPYQRFSMRRGLAQAAAATLAVLGLAGPAHAAYPDKPIRIIVPFGAGTSPDAVARVLERSLSVKMGTSVIVENRAGAAGNIGIEYASRAAPDGYTLLLAGTNSVVAGSIYKNLKFDIKRDFMSVSLLGAVPSVLVVSSSSKIDSLASLVSYAKANPGKVTFASSGTGTTSHLAGELFNRTANVKMVHVPYPAAGRAMMDIVSGRVDLLFDNLPASVPQLKGGSTRALGIASMERNAAIADVPTIDESGFKGFIVEPWYSIMAPKGTPESIVQQVNAHIRATLAEPEYADKLKALGLRLMPGTAQQMDAFVDAEARKWGQLVTEAGIQAE